MRFSLVETISVSTCFRRALQLLTFWKNIEHKEDSMAMLHHGVFMRGDTENGIGEAEWRSKNIVERKG